MLKLIQLTIYLQADVVLSATFNVTVHDGNTNEDENNSKRHVCQILNNKIAQVV